MLGHIAKKCRQSKKSRSQTSQPQQANFNQIDATNSENDDEVSVNYLISYRELYEQVYDSNYDTDSDDYVAAIFGYAANQLEPLNVKVQFGTNHRNLNDRFW